MSLKINILGTEYTVNYYDYDAKPIFKDRSIGGYHDSADKEIAIVNLRTYPGYEAETEEYCHKIEKETLRHEIVHAFLTESGLADSTSQFGGGWAKNEEMVDWIALQFPKMLRAMQDAGAL